MATTWGDIVVVGIYAPASIFTDIFKVFFDGVRDCMAHFLPYPVLILEDFKAKSTLFTLWGSSRTNVKGEVVAD